MSVIHILAQSAARLNRVLIGSSPLSRGAVLRLYMLKALLVARLDRLVASLARPAARPLSALGRWTEPVRVVVPPPARPAVPPPAPAQIPETLKMMGFPTGPVKPMPLPSPPVGSRSTDTLCHSPPVCLRGCTVDVCCYCSRGGSWETGPSRCSRRSRR